MGGAFQYCYYSTAWFLLKDHSVSYHVLPLHVPHLNLQCAALLLKELSSSCATATHKCSDFIFLLVYSGAWVLSESIVLPASSKRHTVWLVHSKAWQGGYLPLTEECVMLYVNGNHSRFSLRRWRLSQLWWVHYDTMRKLSTLRWAKVTVLRVSPQIPQVVPAGHIKCATRDVDS